MIEQTARLAMPLLAAGQAQKEVTHNEALAAIDALLQPCAETIGEAAPPADPSIGQCWIVGAGATGAWAGQADSIACRTAGGWRFHRAIEGMALWVAAAGVSARYRDGAWRVGEVAAASIVIDGNAVLGARQPAISTPAGGTNVDVEARVAIAALLEIARNHGLIAS